MRSNRDLRAEYADLLALEADPRAQRLIADLDAAYEPRDLPPSLTARLREALNQDRPSAPGRAAPGGGGRGRSPGEARSRRRGNGTWAVCSAHPALPRSPGSSRSSSR